MILIFSFQLRAGTTYNVTANTSWNGNYPYNCASCTFNISSGVTLTLNTNATCATCIFNGPGTITMTSDFTFQASSFNNLTMNLGGFTANLQNNGTSFSNSTVNATGASTFLPTGSLSISGSTFNFSGSYFYGNSFFNATAGPVNLNSSTQIVAGDGTSSSKAYILLNGPTLNLVDAASALYAANVNNYYANWSSYNSQSNSKSYATAGNNKNCGGSGQNSCSAQLFYGCASFSSSGPVTCTTLAVSITDFRASLDAGEIKLRWAASGLSGSNYFKVERSTDGIHFTPLTTIEADDIDAYYSFTDASPQAGENEYRISLTGPDGNIRYSPVVSVQNANEQEVSVFPNPVNNGHFFVRTNTTESLTLSIYTLQGQLIYMTALAGQTRYTLNLPESKSRQMLLARIVSVNKSFSFNLLNIP